MSMFIICYPLLEECRGCDGATDRLEGEGGNYCSRTHLGKGIPLRYIRDMDRAIQTANDIHTEPTMNCNGHSETEDKYELKREILEVGIIQRQRS